MRNEMHHKNRHNLPTHVALCIDEKQWEPKSKGIGNICIGQNHINSECLEIDNDQQQRVLKEQLNYNNIRNKIYS